MTIKLWGNKKLVNTTTTSSQYSPVVTTLLNGDYVVAWTDSSNHLVKFQRFDAAGKKLGVETVATTSFPGTETDQPSIVTLQNGNFAIAMREIDGSLEDVIVSIYRESGGHVGTSFIASYARSPFILAQGGGFNVTLTEVDSTTFQFPRTWVFDLNSAVLGSIDIAGPNDGVGTALISNPRIATGGDAYTTTSQLENQAALYIESIGATDHLRFRLAADTFTGSLAAPVTLHSSPTGTINSLSILTYSFDDFLVFGNLYVVSWAYQSDVVVRMTAYNGNAAWSKTVKGQSSDITLLSDGSIALVWSTVTVAGDHQLRMQLLDIDGNTIGSELVLYVSVGETAEMPVVTELADGRLLLVWTDASNTSDGSGSAINQQIVDPRDGDVVGSNQVGVSETLYGNDLYNDQIQGLAGIDTIFGLAGADVLYGGIGNDTLHGGRGDDTLYGGADQDSMLGGLGADEIDGGAGVDTANYALASFAVTVSLDGTLEGTSEAFGDTYISVENLTGSNIAAQGDTLRGDAAANTIAGLAGNDFINAVGGHDRITGGAGIDTMTGGIGNDSFIYNTLTEGNDIITDFSSFAANNDDVLRFKGSVFGGLAAGNITSAQFQSSTADVAANTNIRFFYETDTRILRFDADGSGTGAAITIATLQTGATMSFNDILMF